MIDIRDLLATCAFGAEIGAKELMRRRGGFETREKSPRDLVTDADLASQEAIRAVIAERFPDHGFLGEESPDRTELDEPYCWVVDPLDGTTNYTHGFPCFAVSIAVAHQGRPVAGAVLDPIRGECFTAAQGLGSHLNGKAIQVSQTSSVADSLVAVSFPPNLHKESPDLEAFLNVAPLCQAVRRTGSAALNLSYVACGRLDAHWAHEIHPWDSAAGVLLVAEAGGKATSCRGEEYSLKSGDYLVASGEVLHTELLELIGK